MARKPPDRSAPPTRRQVLAAWRKYDRLLLWQKMERDSRKAEAERVRLLLDTTCPADPLAALLSAARAFADRYYPDAVVMSVHLSFPDDEYRGHLSMPVVFRLRGEGRE